MTVRNKPVQLRKLKTDMKYNSIAMSTPQPITNDDYTNKKNKSNSGHGHNVSKSLNSARLPSLYSNNLKYFLKEATVKEMKKRDYNYHKQNPSYIL